MTRYPFMCVALAVLVAATAACSGSPSKGGPTSSGSPTGKPLSNGTFVIGLPSAPDKLEPIQSALVITQEMSTFAYDALIRQDEKGNYVPNLASSWTVNASNIVFKVRTDVTCSDGSALTEQTIANNINYVDDKKNASPLRDTYFTGDATATADTTAHTVTVSTPQPDQFLLLGLSQLPIECQPMLDNPKAYTDKTLGSGPWVLSSSVPGQTYTYTKRDGYKWGPGKGDMDAPGVPAKVQFKVVTDVTTLANLVLSGQVNYASITGPDEDRLLAAKIPYVGVTATPGETLFNEAAGRPAADHAVREALVLATDIAAVRKVATQGKGSASTGLVMAPPLSCMGDTVAGNLPDYDPAKAKQVLDQAGWAVGSGGVRSKDGKQLVVTFLYPQNMGSAGSAGAELLAQEWQAVGAKVTLKAFTSQELGNIVFSTGEWDAGWISITVGQPGNLVPFYSGEAPPNGNNFTHIDNATYNAAVAKARTMTGDEGCAQWATAEKSLFTNFDVAPMFNTTTKFFTKNVSLQAPLGFSVFADTIRMYQ